MFVEVLIAIQLIILESEIYISFSLWGQIDTNYLFYLVLEISE